MKLWLTEPFGGGFEKSSVQPRYQSKFGPDVSKNFAQELQSNFEFHFDRPAISKIALWAKIFDNIFCSYIEGDKKNSRQAQNLANSKKSTILLQSL